MIGALIGLWCAPPARAGAWTREVGQLYAKAGADVYHASRFVAPSQLEAPGGSYTGQQYSLYGEAGVLPGYKGQLSLSLPLVVGAHRSEIDDAFGGSTPFRATSTTLGDLQTAAQIALHPKIPLSFALAAKIPMYANGDVGDRYPTYATLFPKPGDGQIDLTAWLYAGAAPTAKIFCEAGLGYRHRTETFVGWQTSVTLVDGFPFVAKAGMKLGRFLPIVGVDGLVAVRKDDWTRQWLTLSGNALVDIADGVAIEPRLSADLWARNASFGFGSGLGISVRR